MDNFDQHILDEPERSDRNDDPQRNRLTGLLRIFIGLYLGFIILFIRLHVFIHHPFARMEGFKPKIYLFLMALILLVTAWYMVHQFVLGCREIGWRLGIGYQFRRYHFAAIFMTGFLIIQKMLTFSQLSLNTSSVTLEILSGIYVLSLIVVLMWDLMELKKNR